jgi:hypothetical protein
LYDCEQGLVFSRKPEKNGGIYLNFGFRTNFQEFSVNLDTLFPSQTIGHFDLFQVFALVDLKKIYLAIYFTVFARKDAKIGYCTVDKCMGATLIGCCHDDRHVMEGHFRAV